MNHRESQYNTKKSLAQGQVFLLLGSTKYLGLVVTGSRVGAGMLVSPLAGITLMREFNVRAQDVPYGKVGTWMQTTTCQQPPARSAQPYVSALS
jgi:hypothetical protein